MENTADTAAERRLRVRRRRAERDRKQNQDLYPGLNDFTDALEALPAEVVRYFTLLREIDAKCISTVPQLKQLIAQFFEYPEDSEDSRVNEERQECLTKIRGLMREMMPCQEEKMQVAGAASEVVARIITRMNNDYEIIKNNEIPELVRFGPADHPAIVSDSKQNEQAKNSQTSRSESRREAIAAKKAAQQQQQLQNQDKRPSGRGTTVNGGSGSGSGRNKPGPKPKNKPNTPQPVGSNKRRRGAESNNNNNDDDDESRPDTPNSSSAKRSRQQRSTAAAAASKVKDEDNDVYCYCQQHSFGQMVGCDGPDCKLEWFHLSCIGLQSPPKGQWYCDECSKTITKKPRR